MNDTQSKIGQLLDEGEQRDAIHVAVAPVEAGEFLAPGMRIALDREGRAVAWEACPLGIVDPFLGAEAEPGDRIWMFMWPNTITGMKHTWEHPAFDSGDDRRRVSGGQKESERWLRAFCRTHDCPDYETVIRAAAGEHPNARLDDLGDGLLLHFHDIDAHSDIPPEFWDHVEVVTGKTIPPEDRASAFSCSC